MSFKNPDKLKKKQKKDVLKTQIPNKAVSATKPKEKNMKKEYRKEVRSNGR